MSQDIARKADVARGVVNPLNREEQPIILVPGIMGSRLHVAGDPGRPLWDPDNTKAMLRLADLMTWPRARLMGLKTRGQVYRKGPSAAKLTASQVDRGWGGLAWGFYGAGLRGLDTASRGIGGVVYGFGYDWRQSNWLSGQQLAQRIREIRGRHNNKKVLVVTHSMGGLVTRAACAQGAETDVLGVVHTMQPANGTPLAYRQFKTGAAALHWVLADVVLGRIMGRTPIQHASVAHGLRAPFELLPNAWHYRTTGDEVNEPPATPLSRRGWLSWDAKLPVSVNATNIYDVYLERTGRLGLIDYNYYRDNEKITIAEAYVFAHYIYGREIHDGIRTAVRAARQFHEDRLRNYVHPNTSVVAGNGLETDVAVHLNRETHWFSDDTSSPAMIREDYGDATVALSSSTSLPLKGNSALGVTARDRQAFVSGVQHAAAFGLSQNFREWVWRMCQQVIRCAPAA